MIEKDTIPNSPTDFTYTDNIAAPCAIGPLEDDGDENLNPSSETCTNVAPGSYTVTEDRPGPSHALTDLTCTDTDTNGVDSTGDTQTRTATINLDPGETVTCSFENTEQGTVVIEKDTIPNSGTDFTYTDNIAAPCAIGPLEDDGDENLNPSSETCTNVAPGSYTVTEDDPGPGHALTDLTCTDTDTNGVDSTGDTQTRAATINLDARRDRHLQLREHRAGDGGDREGHDPERRHRLHLHRQHRRPLRDRAARG